jgi:hypothetical protein
MRDNIAIAMIAAGCLVIGLLYSIRQKNNPRLPAANFQSSAPALQQPSPPAAGSSAQVAASATAQTPPEQTNLVRNLANPGVSAQAIPGSLQDAARTRQDAYVAARISELQDLAMDNASSSLDSILSELTNSDPQIRKAALDATIQFASRDAIPKLAEVAAQTDDTQEKAALNDAIDYLKLPSLTEVLAASKNPRPLKPVKAARPGLPAMPPQIPLQQ